MVALLEERDPQILHDLDADGIDARELHADVRRHLGSGDDRLWEGILVTPRVRKIIVLAEGYAGEAPVEPAHLLRALRAEGGSLAAEILRRTAGRNSATGA
jgi:hypothetical protein